MTTSPSSSSAASVGLGRPATDEIPGDAVTVGGGDPVAVGIQIAVADAVGTIVDEALDNAAEAQDDALPAGSGSPLSLTDAVTADGSGWAAARMSALQAAAATATAEVAKSLAETGTRYAKEQAAAVAEFSRDRSNRAAGVGRSQALQLAAAARKRAAGNARLRILGRQLANPAASNTALQRIRGQVRKEAELKQEQATRLRRRRLAIVVVVAAIVGVAVGLYERRRRAASANLLDSYDHDVTVTLPNAEPLSSEASAVQGITDAQ